MTRRYRSPAAHRRPPAPYRRRQSAVRGEADMWAGLAALYARSEAAGDADAQRAAEDAVRQERIRNSWLER